jgi:hypothetical protein
MNFGQLITNINYWAVLVSACSAFIIGWIWYGPLFGKLWMKLNGFTEEGLKEGGMSMPAMMLLNYVATALAALAIAMFIGTEANAGFGIFAGVMIAIFWIGTNRLNDVLYERKPWGLYFINVGYNLVIYAVMGAIIGLWH